MFAILELTSWSEIAALIAIFTFVWAVLSTLLVMWLGTKFVNKKAYYKQREEDERSAKEAKTEETKGTKDQNEKLLLQITELNANMNMFILKLAEWKTEFVTRLAILEDRQKRGEK